jgi:hypothetical protein
MLPDRVKGKAMVVLLKIDSSRLLYMYDKPQKQLLTNPESHTCPALT